MMNTNINVSIVKGEVVKIFGMKAKNKLKMLTKNVKVYSEIDNLKADIEILADKSVFAQLLIKEKWYFDNVKSFNPSNAIGEMAFTEFDTMCSTNIVSTVKAIHGVKNDVYQYEVQLKSQGSMHLGWATQNCVFSNTQGVGETKNSYGFDGHYTIKLNMSNKMVYGRQWRIGNIIGCVIDIPKKTIEYFNNGRSLGVAFEILSEPDDTTQYFPAITLFYNEYVTVNLGERPFKFPIPKAKPVINKPTVVVSYFKQLQQKIVSLIDSKISLQTVKENMQHSNKVTVNNVMSNVLFYQFAYLLKFRYVIDGCFLSFLNYLSKNYPKKLQVLLELMWENIPEHEMIFIMDHLLFCMLCEFQCIWRSEFNILHQTMVLKLLIEICQETTTRKQLIVKVFFDRIKFANFLHVIAPSEEMFSYMMPMVYWHLDDQIIPENLNVKISRYFPRENYNDHELSYNIACSQIKYSVNELVNLQIVFLKTLLDDDDQTETKVSSRILFSRQFQRFIQENIIAWRNNLTLKLPNPVLLSTLFRMLYVVRDLWNEELKEDNIAKVHQNIFYLENFNYFGIDRIGGTFSYLRSKYIDMNSKLSGHDSYSENNSNTHADTIGNQYHDDSSDVNEEDMMEMNSAAGLLAVITGILGNAAYRDGNTSGADETIFNEIFLFDNLPTDKRHVLSVLLNNVICLYYKAGYKQLIEFVSLKDRLPEFLLKYALEDFEQRNATEANDDIRQILQNYEKKITVACRHIAWLMNVIFTNANENLLEWILAVNSNTIKCCSQTEGELFRFVPEYYVENTLTLLALLSNYPNKIVKSNSIIIEKEWLATLIGEITFEMFGDTRIIHPNSKNIIIRTVILYLIHPKSVSVLQAVSEKSRLQVIQSILTSVEEILWSKRYMVLMLIWQGSGFAYRYTQPPHLEQQELSSGVKSFEEIIFTTKTIERPPAIVLQNDVRKIIAYDNEMAYNFIINSLNYLNWAFSEFISLLQEINDILSENDESIILTQEEERKLISCNKHFIYTAMLLRVIEMIISFDCSLITDEEGSLARFFQLICQILNRVQSSTSTFQKMLTSFMPYTEAVHKFTILVPIVGILLMILDSEIYDELTTESENFDKIHHTSEITDMLISDSNFNLSSLNFIIIPEHHNDEPFTFNSYKNYISEEELKKSANLYKHLDWCAKRHKSMASSINEDDLCTICYSKKISVVLQPCKHYCCKFCIDHHLLYSRVCFFCKRRIEFVEDINNSSTILYDFGSEPPPLL